MNRRVLICVRIPLLIAVGLACTTLPAKVARAQSVGIARDVSRDAGLRRVPQSGKRADLPAVGRQQALSRERRLLRVPHVGGGGDRRVPARGPVDCHDRFPEGLCPLPCPGSPAIRPIPPFQRRAHSRLAGQQPGGSDRRQPRHDHAGLPEGLERRSSQRLLAMPRQRGQGAPRREAGPGHLAQYGYRPDQPRRLRRLLFGVPQSAFLLGLPGAPSRQLRQMPHGSGPPADGNLLRVEARHRLPRVQGRAEYGILQMDCRRGLPPRPLARPAT